MARRDDWSSKVTSEREFQTTQGSKGKVTNSQVKRQQGDRTVATEGGACGWGCRGRGGSRGSRILGTLGTRTWLVLSQAVKTPTLCLQAAAAAGSGCRTRSPSLSPACSPLLARQDQLGPGTQDGGGLLWPLQGDSLTKHVIKNNEI